MGRQYVFCPYFIWRQLFLISSCVGILRVPISVRTFSNLPDFQFVFPIKAANLQGEIDAYCDLYVFSPDNNWNCKSELFKSAQIGIELVYSQDQVVNLDGVSSSMKMRVGKHTYGFDTISFANWGESENVGISIGRYCQIAGNVKIFLGGNHQYKRVAMYPFETMWKTKYDTLKLRYPELNEIATNPYSKGPVTIGNDVWIAESATILSGVTIGDGAIVGASAVVRESIPPYAIVTGNPGKIVGYRHNEEQIKKLLAIKWWEWTEEQILDAMPLLLHDNITLFIDKYYVSSSSNIDGTVEIDLTTVETVVKAID